MELSNFKTIKLKSYNIFFFLLPTTKRLRRRRRNWASKCLYSYSLKINWSSSNFFPISDVTTQAINFTKVFFSPFPCPPCTTDRWCALPALTLQLLEGREVGAQVAAGAQRGESLRRIRIKSILKRSHALFLSRNSWILLSFPSKTDFTSMFSFVNLATKVACLLGRKCSRQKRT